MVRRTQVMAGDLNEPHIHALAYSATCLVAFHNGRWRAANAAAVTAANTLREHSVGIVKEIASIQITGLASQVFTGDFVGMAERLPPILRAAELRGDLFSLASKRSGFINALWLAQDKPALARQQAERAMQGWESEGYVIQHFFDLWARTQINLYEGDGVAASARVAIASRAFQRSTLTRLPFLRACADDLFGRAALANLDGRRALSTARASAAALAKQGMPWTDGLSDALTAGVAWHTQGPAAAEALLAGAAIRFERADMESHAAAMVWARSQCTEGRRADDLRLEAQERFARCGVLDPPRWSAMLFPALTFR
jgi:hypothetical protein